MGEGAIARVWGRSL